MTKREYESIGRKLRSAYDALEQAIEGAGYSERIQLAEAKCAIRRAAPALKVQVCRNCNSNGRFAKPGDPYTSYGCLHEDVPLIFPEDD